MNIKRKSKYGIQKNILNRWSPRKLTGEEINDKDLMALFEAASYAPSAMNNQLTRFIYVKKDSNNWSVFFNFLNKGNKDWCKNASALVVIISRKNSYYKNNPQKKYSFEAGAAFENMAIEATSRGIIAHAMGGFDEEKLRKNLKIDDVWSIEVMVAVGFLDKKSDEEASIRKPLNELVFEGEFKE